MNIDALRMISDVHMRASCPSRISVPSRGFCFLGKHDLEILERLVPEQCMLGKLLLLGGVNPP